jgi:diaminopropionate ammonia-lyase
VLLYPNLFRKLHAGVALPTGIEFPSSDPAHPLALLARCPAYMPTPLHDLPEIARVTGIASLSVKDERTRMGLGSFKALGAAYVVADDAVHAGTEPLSEALNGVTYVTASAGNHGMSVAAAAQLFGAKSVIYIAETVPESFARRLAEKGARVVREGAEYEGSMAAAAKAAEDNDWRLLSDSSWDGYTDRPWRLMQGYLTLMAEVADQIAEPPTHIFVQAGVGGLAAAVAAYTRAHWGDAPGIIVVEPDAAPAIAASLTEGHAVKTAGPVSSMGRLDCKEPSLIALKGLARDADVAVTLSDDSVARILPRLAAHDLDTTPSGAAGLAALLMSEPHRKALRLDEHSRVLTFLTEGPEV